MRSHFLIVALVLCGTGMNILAAAPIQSERSTKVKINDHYAGARLKLIRQGWQIDREWGISGVHEKLTYAQYPEVLCGEGYQAVCTGRFKKGDSAILLTINQFKKNFPVKYINND